MRRDPQLKTILSTDTQNTAIDKINSNFLGIHYLAGGNLGGRGLTGPTGALGLPGNPGPTGNDGIRGNRWFVGDFEPSGGLGDVILPKDYWVNTDSGVINEFSQSGWGETAYSIEPISEFAKFTSITGISGSGPNAIYYKKTPESTTFNFSDVTLDSSNSNPLHSMFMLSTDGSVEAGAFSLLEFSRGELADGTPAEYLKHPLINFIDTADNNSDVLFLVPQDKLTINSIDTSDSVAYNIDFSIDGALNIRTSTGFTLESTAGSENGFNVYSTGTISISAEGAFKPTYKNIGFDNNISRINRIKLNSRLIVESSSTQIPGIKISSKVDTTTTGYGSLGVGLSGGNFDDTSEGYRPENYAIKIGTINGSTEKNRFSISSAGSIYRQKENSGFSIISDVTNAKSYNGSLYRIWYTLGNKDLIINDRNASFASDKNEILIDPIGIPDGYILGVGLQFHTLNGVSYLNNIKHIGETLKIRVRSINDSIKIGSVGITYVSSTLAQNNYAFPYTQTHNFNNASSVVDFTIVKQVSGHTTTGDYVYYDGAGESGFWITTN